jgi:hypothetical protein
MSRGVFRSHNKVGETMTFQTNASSATTFDPRVSFGYGSDRVSWDVGDGSGYQAGNSLSYVYSDTGTTKTVTLRTNRLLRLEAMDAEARNIVGNLDLSGWVNLSNGPTVNNYNQFGVNPQMTGITNPNSAVNGKIITHYNLYNSNITGVLVLTGLTLGGYFTTALNSNLTGIIHGPSNQAFTNRYNASSCNLTGNLDVSMLTKLGSDFRVNGNSALTGITHTASTEVFDSYWVQSCNLIGNHDVSMLILSDEFLIYDNPLLTGITHTASTEVFVNYFASDCNLTGTLDLSMLTGLGGQFVNNSNPNLTNILMPTTTQTFTFYDIYSCDLDYINFLPLSGANMNLVAQGFRMQNNNMSVDEVNNILVDFDNISTNLNPAGWTGTTLDISGTNAAPDDGTGGGGDGLAALASLTGATNNWTITTS